MRRCLRYKEDFYKMKKVIAFVSVFSNAFHLNRSPDKYYYDEDGNCVEGRQTNEAPLKYLLTKHNDINEIICLVSDTANKPPEWKPDNNLSAEDFLKKMGTKSPYEYLKEQVNQYVMAHPELFPKGKTFLTVIPEILDRVRPDDTIFLDTTGGPRISVIQMMFLARTLTYQGITLDSAVYSEYNRETQNKLYNVTEYFLDFDLLNGLNEFVSTGATGMFESYIREKLASSETAKALVLAIKKLNEAIILARIPKIQERKNEVEKLLDKARQELAERKESGSSILRILLPILGNKYSQISTIPDLIKWCASNNLIPQAFTLYKDWIPEYLIKTTGIISLPDIIPERYTNDGKPIEPNLYCCIFDNEYVKAQSDHIYSPIQPRDKDYYVRIIRNIKKLMHDNASHIQYKTGINHRDIAELLMNYSYAAQFRNDFNHGIDSSKDKYYIKQRIRFLSTVKTKNGSQKYIFDVDELEISYLKNFLIEAIDQILDLANR